MTSIHTFRAAITACAIIASGTGLVRAGSVPYFNYTDNGTTITIDKLNSETPSHLVVPATIDGKPVTALGANAFRHGIFRTISLPDTIQTIGPGAFYDCGRMVGVDIPDGVTSIEDSTFGSCEDLTVVTLPGSVTYIGKSAFATAYGLQDVIMPGVTHIDTEAFARCRKLSKPSMPPGLKSMGDRVFLYSAVQEIEFPASAITLGDNLFTYCYKLKSVKLPAGLPRIGTEMFMECTSLETVTLPDSVTTIGEQAFAGSGLKKIKLGTGLTSIGNSAFANSKLTGIEFGPKIETIGEKAFYLCADIKRVEFPKSVTSIGTEAFTGRNLGLGLSSAIFSGKAPEWGKPSSRMLCPASRYFWKRVPLVSPLHAGRATASPGRPRRSWWKSRMVFRS